MPFIIFVAGDLRYFKFSLCVEHSKSQPTGDKSSLKWAWSRHVTNLFIFSPPEISLQRLKLETSNLVCMLIIAKRVPARAVELGFKNLGF